MTVRPTTSGQTPRAGIDRAGKTSASAPPARSSDPTASAPPASSHDNVEISAQARELQKLDPARGSAGELAPERLRAVLGRISGGYYDQPGVRDEVIRRIAREL